MKLSAPGDCEINAMTTAAAHTTVPVPSILRVVRSAKDPPDWRYIIIRYIPGRTLEECWASLSWWRKVIVLWTLRRYVRQFRKIPLGNSPPGPIGDGPQVCVGPTFTDIYVCIGSLPRSAQTGANHHVGIDWPQQGSGPFATYAEMSAWFARRLVISQRFKYAPKNAAPFDSSLPLVFTHSDLSPRNLILDERNTLWVLDLQLSGFYPQWFEYVGVLSTWGSVKHYKRIAAFVAGSYREQTLFIFNVGWALNTGHLIQ